MDSKSSSSPLEIPPLLLWGLLLVCIVAFTAFTLWVVFRKRVENQAQAEGATTGGIGENDEDQRFGGMGSKKSAQKRQKTMMQKVIHGSMAGLVIFTAPLYALGFGLIGYKIMWRISKVIYGISRPSESILHDHFDRMQKFLETGTKEAALKSKAYMIHPTFAGLSLISSMLLAFVDPLKIEAFIPFHLLLKLNVFICIVSALAARPLTKTMIGNRNAKKWIVLQGNLSMVSAVFAVIPGTFGRLMIHLNWATLFSGGVLERLYVLSFLSQVGATNTKTYIDWYSPQIKVATLLSIPLAIASFMFYH
eukprot:scaffold510_cov141-Skeletonema_marinoi.AAC.3